MPPAPLTCARLGGLAAGVLLLWSLRYVPLDRAQAHDSRSLAVGKEIFLHERRVHGTRVVAKGSTHFHIFVIPVCSAVLYLEPHAHNDQVLASVPTALEIAYKRKVSAADFRESTETLIARNGLMTPRIAALVLKFNALYRDIKPGDRYLLEWHPRHFFPTFFFTSSPFFKVLSMSPDLQPEDVRA